MRQADIERQIKVIERATENALKSKESALKFLKDAGIIPSDDKPVRKKKKSDDKV